MQPFCRRKAAIHLTLDQCKVSSNYTSAKTWLIPTGLRKSTCRCKKEQHAERKPHEIQTPEWRDSMGVSVARSDERQGCLPPDCPRYHATVRDRARSAG